MTKRRKSNEKVAAEHQPETLPAGGEGIAGASPAEGVVEEPDRDAAQAAAQEQPGEPAGADPADGVDVSDGQSTGKADHKTAVDSIADGDDDANGNRDGDVRRDPAADIDGGDDREPDAGARGGRSDGNGVHDDGSDRDLQKEGLSDEKAAEDAGGGSEGLSDAPAPLVSEELPADAAGAGVLSAGADPADPVERAGGAHADAQDPEKSDVVETVGIDAGDGSAAGTAITSTDGVYLGSSDGGLSLFDVAAHAGRSAYMGACHLAYLYGFGDVRDADFLDRIEREALGALVLNIRERATPEVLAQQLTISRIRPTADLNTPQRIGLSVFASTLLQLEDFGREEAARIARRMMEANRKPAEPTPIEDTMLAPVDDVMGGW